MCCRWCILSQNGKLSICVVRWKEEEGFCRAHVPYTYTLTLCPPPLTSTQGGHAHGYSSAYIVTAQPAARKLYGPSLVI